MTTKIFNGCTFIFGPRGPHLRITLAFDRTLIVGGVDNMAVTMTVTQKVHATIQPVDAHGNSAPVDGIPVWTVSDATMLSVAPGADGMTCDILAVGKVGDAQATVTCDADMGAGVVEITGVVDFHLLAAQAVGVSVNVGAPVEQ